MDDLPISAIVELFYNSDLTTTEFIACAVAFVVVLEFIATIVSALSRMGR